MVQSTSFAMTEYKRKSNRPLIFAIVAGATLIAIGLAVGLAIGLQNAESANSASSSSAYDSPSNGTSDTAAGDAETAEYLSANGEYRYASVSTDTDVCSTIATDIMAINRGNAFDAAIAARFCLGLVNAHSCGLGGGFFMVIYDKKNDSWHTINSREEAPGRSTQDMFVDDLDLARYGGMASAIPGEVYGLWMLHEKLGSLPWADLVQPSIDMCKTGIPVTLAVRKAAVITFNTDELKETYSEYFSNQGFVLQEGKTFVRPDLEKTLQTIRDDPLSFYNGSLANDIVKDIREAGGIFTLQDLANYESKWVDTISLTLPDGDVIHSANAPGGGPTLLYILSILAGYNIDPSHIASLENETLTYHRIVEAFKFAFGKRTELGDPDFVNIEQSLAEHLDLEFGEDIRSLIDDFETHDTDYYYSAGPQVDNRGTAHMSIVDVEGNVVSVTSTINHYFGSLVKGKRTGIIFNDNMGDFSTPNTTNSFGVPASEANFIAPGKRPMSSMSPAIVWDSARRRFKLATGASGGTMIPTAVAQNIMDILWLGYGAPESVDRPRLHHQLEPDYIEMEELFPEEIAIGLREKGHVANYSNSYAVIQAINNVQDTLVAVADYRKGGVPDGF